MLVAIGAYVLAVGPQPSVIRAGVAGALASLAWLSGRQRDRWYALLVAAVVLLAWNPYNALDPGFQLSFAAVLSIFVLVPRFQRVLEGYPLPSLLRAPVAISAACGLGTAPVSLVPVPRDSRCSPFRRTPPLLRRSRRCSGSRSCARSSRRSCTARRC